MSQTNARVLLRWNPSPSANVTLSGVKLRIEEPDGTVREAQVPTTTERQSSLPILVVAGSKITWSVITAGKTGDNVESEQHSFTASPDGIHVLPATQLGADAIFGGDGHGKLTGDVVSSVEPSGDENTELADINLDQPPEKKVDAALEVDSTNTGDVPPPPPASETEGDPSLLKEDADELPLLKSNAPNKGQGKHRRN